MAPPKKQKKEYNTGDVVWVKVKGWPVWPGQVEDVKSVTNESVIKNRRKNAVLIKFLENGTYSWANHDDISPFQSDTLENFLISANHKNFKSWKKAFKQCAKAAGIEASVIEDTVNKAKTAKPSPSPKKRKERENDATTSAKRRKSSSASPSPKRTARHASTGDKKKGSPKKAATPRKIPLKPTLEGNENLFNELSTLLVKYNEESDKLYQLLKIVSNFAIPDISLFGSTNIANIIQKLSKDGTLNPNVQKIAIKITEYYDSLTKVEEKEEEKKEENGGGAEGGEEKKEESSDIVITENTESKPAEDTPMVTETAATETTAAESDVKAEGTA